MIEEAHGAGRSCSSLPASTRSFIGTDLVFSTTRVNLPPMFGQMMPDALEKLKAETPRSA
jgi:hypothetical protein